MVRTRAASLDLTLNADGTTTGRAFVPGGDEGGADFDVDLTGSWTLSGSTVTFAHDADTFIRDMPFTFDGARLWGQRTFAGDDVTIRVVLTRQ